MAIFRRMSRVFAGAAAVAVALLVVNGCAPERVDQAYAPSRAFSRYRHALIDLGVDRAELGSLWLEAAETALHQPERVDLPLSYTLIFDPAEPEAAAFEFTVRRGQKVVIRVQPDIRPPLLFADLYRLHAERDDPPQKVASLDRQNGRLEFRARREAAYLFRLQPEIARGGRVRVEIESTS